MQAPMKKQTIDILVDGKRKRFRGVTKYTTCDDIIKMMTLKTGQKHGRVQFSVFESFSGRERQLSRKDRILKVIRSSGSDGAKAGIIILRVDEVRTKMVELKDKKKRLKLLRTKVFDAKTVKNEIYIDKGDNTCTLDFTNSSETLKNCLSELPDRNCTTDYNDKFSGLKRKYENDPKVSVFRKIFTNVLKKKIKSKGDKKRVFKLQKRSMHGRKNVIADKTKFTYLDLQQSFKAQLDTVDVCDLNAFDKNAELDMAFIDDSDMDISNVSVLNQCIVEDIDIDCEDMDESLEDDQAQKKGIVNIKNISVAEQTLVKLDRIKQILDLHNVHCISEDDLWTVL